MPKGIPKNGINKGWFKDSKINKECLFCHNEFKVIKCRDMSANFCSIKCRKEAGKN